MHQWHLRRDGLLDLNPETSKWRRTRALAIRAGSGTPGQRENNHRSPQHSHLRADVAAQPPVPCRNSRIRPAPVPSPATERSLQP